MSSTPTEATVSVLLPTFNRARYLHEAIQSILDQTHRPHQIIVVDDGSTDGTAAICAEFGAAVVYIRNDRNAGKSAAINRGLRHATGAYIWVMDDDDIATGDALETLLAPMIADAQIGFSFGQLRKFVDLPGGGARLTDRYVASPPRAGRMFVSLMEDCFITGQPCTLIRRRCFDAIGPINESVLASVDYNILLEVSRLFEGADVGKVVLWQRQHTGRRGPEQLRYGHQDRVKRWMASDAELISEMLPRLALEEYLGARPADRPLLTLERRQALFQKATIAARKNLWEAAFGALRQARETAGAATLRREEYQVLSRMLGSRYGIDQLIGDRDLQHRLSAAAGRNRLGAEIARAIASHLPYWVRKAALRGDLRRLGQTTAALGALVGVKGAARLILSNLLGRVRIERRRPAPAGQAIWTLNSSH